VPEIPHFYRWCEMCTKESRLPVEVTVLVAVGDGVLADSLRFSLELEGYEVKFCDEHSLLGVITAHETPRLLVLDQDIFARLAVRPDECQFDAFGVPVILMVGHTTSRLLACAAAAGVSRLVEKPLLGGALFDAIRTELSKMSPLPVRRQ
jgi:DNA-binding NtrC family response regulator